MPLVEPVDKDTGILSLAFNQDRTCVAVATVLGIRIFSADMRKVLYAHNVGAVSSVEMLFCTNLLAFVGAGEQPTLTPRQVSIVNTNSKRTIKDISFPTAVLSVKMNRKRLVVVLERKALVYELECLENLRALDTPPNPRGICAISTGDVPCYIALPASISTGIVRIHDAMVDGGNAVCDIVAHKSPVSTRSTEIAHPEESHGTIHLFKLGNNGWTAVGAAASAAAGLLSAVTRYPVRNLVDPMRSIVSVSLPGLLAPSICAIVPSRLPLADADRGNGSAHIPTMTKASLAVATFDGFFYEYSLTELDGLHPKALRTGEWKLLGSKPLR